MLLYFLLTLIAVGVLLCSPEGKKILKGLLALLMSLGWLLVIIAIVTCIVVVAGVVIGAVIGLVKIFSFAVVTFLMILSLVLAFREKNKENKIALLVFGFISVVTLAYVFLHKA